MSNNLLEQMIGEGGSDERIEHIKYRTRTRRGYMLNADQATRNRKAKLESERNKACISAYGKPEEMKLPADFYLDSIDFNRFERVDERGISTGTNVHKFYGALQERFRVNLIKNTFNNHVGGIVAEHTTNSFKPMKKIILGMVLAVIVCRIAFGFALNNNHSPFSFLTPYDYEVKMLVKLGLPGVSDLLNASQQASEALEKSGDMMKAMKSGQEQPAQDALD